MTKPSSGPDHLLVFLLIHPAELAKQAVLFFDIVHYTIDAETGRLTRAGRQQASVEWPRTFALSPDGQYLLSANRRSSTVSVFRIDQETGALTDTGHSVAVPEPTKIGFADPDRR